MDYAATIPDVSGAAAAVTEWTACVLFWYYAPKRFARNVTLPLMAILLAGQIFLHTHIFEWLPYNITGLPEGMGLLLIRFTGVFCNALFMFLGTLLVTAYPVSNDIYIAAKALVIAELIASAACLLYDGWVLLGYETWWLPEVIFYGSMCLLYLVSMRIPTREESTYLARVRITRNQFLAAVLIAVTVFVVSNSSMLINAMDYSTNGDMLSRVVLRLVGDLCGFAILWVMANHNFENEMQEELAAVKNTMNLQYRQYLSFRDTSEYIARNNHDLKHQLQALRVSATEEERAAYIDEMERMIALNEAWNVTGNSVLDSILTQKKMYCIGHDIEFSCQAQAQDLNELAVRDICALFGNIVDNAIEHVSGYAEREKRIIRGTVERKRAFLVIEFENYYEGPPLPEGELPGTSKKDRASHGFGLKSIQYTADKYNGSMSIHTEGTWFTICVMLPVRSVCTTGSAGR